MELLKKIKQAEAQAEEIVEQARTYAAEEAEKGRLSRLESLAEAEQQRKKTTEAAVARAKSEGLAEAGGLKAEAEKNCRQLRDKTESKMAKAATDVMDYLRD